MPFYRHISKDPCSTPYMKWWRMINTYTMIVHVYYIELQTWYSGNYFSNPLGTAVYFSSKAPFGTANQGAKPCVRGIDGSWAAHQFPFRKLKFVLLLQHQLEQEDVLAVHNISQSSHNQACTSIIAIRCTGAAAKQAEGHWMIMKCPCRPRATLDCPCSTLPAL